jgi:hypothetical protein
MAKIDDFGLMIIRDDATGTYTAYPKNKDLSCLVVQVNSMDEIPYAISEAFKEAVNIAYKMKKYSLIVGREGMTIHREFKI